MLIVMGCAAPKAAGSVAAGWKYETRQHRAMIAELILNGAFCSHDAVILSAKFGVLALTKPVPDYDWTMDEYEMERLMCDDEQIARMKEAVRGQHHVVLYGGRMYRECAKGLLRMAGFVGEVEELVGENRGCGDHFSALVSLFAEWSVDA